jgi:hypothetical protein
VDVPGGVGDRLGVTVDVWNGVNVIPRVAVGAAPGVMLAQAARIMDTTPKKIPLQVLLFIEMIIKQFKV